MHHAQVKCVVPAKVLCINAPSCCTELLQPCFKLHAIDLLRNKRSTQKDRTQLAQCTPTGVVVDVDSWGGGRRRQLHFPNGEPDLGPNNDMYTPFPGSGREWLSNNHSIKCLLHMYMRYPDAKHLNMAGVTACVTPCTLCARAATSGKTSRCKQPTGVQH